MIRLLQLLLLLALGAILWRLLKRWLLAPPEAGDAPRVVQAGRCPQCGTHVPQAELGSDGRCMRCRSGAD